MIPWGYDHCSQWAVRARMPLTAASCKHQQQPRRVLIAWWCCMLRGRAAARAALRGSRPCGRGGSHEASPRGSLKEYKEAPDLRGGRTVVRNGKNQPKLSSLDVIWQNFPNKFQQIQIIFVSRHCKHFIFKICQTIAGRSVISQFHEILNLVLGGFFAIWNHCGLLPSHAAAAAPHSAAGKPTPSLLQWVTSICLSQTNVMGLFTTPSRFS